MNLLLNAAPPTMSSRDIAVLVELRHDNVRRTIAMLADRGVITLPQLEEVPADGPGPRTITCYRVGKRDSYVIVAQLSPPFTARLVDRWQELESASMPAMPQTYAQALRLCADQAEQMEHQAKQLAIAAPKAAFVDRYVQSSTGSRTFREVAKLLQVKEPRLRAWMAARSIMYQLNGTWVPYAMHLDAGRFEVRAGESHGHSYSHTRFTAKGVEWIAGEWAKMTPIACGVGR
jgi:phage antirepressor YoqD-like protein